MARIVIYVDTEFSEDGNNRPIEPLSVGMVKASGETLYVCNREANFNACNDWVKKNVLPNMTGEPNEWVKLVLNPMAEGLSPVWKTKVEIKQAILDFVGNDTPVWVAWFADYDHVVVSQLFGAMVLLPRGWPMYTIDLKQVADAYGNPRMPVNDDDKHNALSDALRLKGNAKWLKDYIKNNPDKYNPVF